MLKVWVFCFCFFLGGGEESVLALKFSVSVTLSSLVYVYRSAFSIMKMNSGLILNNVHYGGPLWSTVFLVVQDHWTIILIGMLRIYGEWVRQRNDILTVVPSWDKAR